LNLDEDESGEGKLAAKVSRKKAKSGGENRYLHTRGGAGKKGVRHAVRTRE